jgi:predicted ester cyclase
LQNKKGENADISRKQSPNPTIRGGVEYGNLALLDEFLAPNVACRFYGLAEVNGLEAFKQMAPAFAAAFSESWFTIETIIAEEDLVAIHYRWRGTQRGTYLGIAATGKQVTETGTRFYRISGGKIAEMGGDENVLGLLQQLDAVPQLG